MLQEQPGPNEKEAQSDVDDGDDSPDADELPIAEPGALGKLPSGNIFNSVGRIRITINAYVEEMQSVGWYVGFKLPTTQALYRRLQNHYQGIMSCAHCDVQIGYKQCRARVCAMIELHKAISKWLSTHDDDELISILNPFKILQSYLDYMELGVGEDLREDRDIPFYLAKTLERCKKVGIATGPQMLNLTVMEELVEGVQRKQVEQKPPSEPQSKEDAVKVQSADESEEPQKEPARKKRRGYHGPARLKMESRTDFTVSAACHVMASLFKPMLFKLTKDFLDDDALILKAIGDFEAASAFWAATAKGGDDRRATNR